MKVHRDWINKAGVYKINFKTECYIGSSKNLYNRLTQHMSHLRNNKHHSKYMQRCFNKYGENMFNIEILEIIDYDEKILREKELYYIKFYKSKFNSTTPIEYHHSIEMKNKISKTLKRKYKNKEIIPVYPNLGQKISVFNFKGEIIYKNIFIKEAIKYLKLSNRSVLNNHIRKGRAISKKQFIIIPENNDFQFLYNWIELQKGKNIPLYQIFETGEIKKCSSSSVKRVLNKVLNSTNYLYYSINKKSYYTFIGNIIKCPFYK